MAKKNKAKKGNVLTGLFTGRGISFNVLKSNPVTIILIVTVLMLNIGVKYTEELRRKQIITYRSELKNVRAQYLKVSIQYQNKTRESEMLKRIEKMNLSIGVPEQPAYNLDERIGK